MIRLPCPNCAAALKVPEDQAGEKIKCPKCQQSVPVPESLEDEPPAEVDEGGRRKLPRWAWAVAALVLIAVVVGVVLVVRSGPKDGLTRAERAELEAKMKRDLPGTWEETHSQSKNLYTFTDDGRFEAVAYKNGKRVGSHVGTWSVSGSRMTLQVTESADDGVKTGKPFEMAVSDVKSEGGKVFKFTISRADSVVESRALTKRDEHPAWLIGPWSTEPPYDLRMEFRFEAGGRFTQSLSAEGKRVNWSAGDWSMEGDRLSLTTRETDKGVPPKIVPKILKFNKAASGDRFTLVSDDRKIEMTFVRGR